jgi:hypothetical protein
MTTSSVSAPPTEAEIRAYLESLPVDHWALNDHDDQWTHYATFCAGAFEGYIESERVTDDEFGVFSDAHQEEADAMLPAITAAIRPLMIEAQVRAAMRFFERFPDVPRAKGPTTG